MFVCFWSPDRQTEHQIEGGHRFSFMFGRGGWAEGIQLQHATSTSTLEENLLFPNKEKQLLALASYLQSQHERSSYKTQKNIKHKKRWIILFLQELFFTFINLVWFWPPAHSRPAKECETTECETFRKLFRSFLQYASCYQTSCFHYGALFVQGEVSWRGLKFTLWRNPKRILPQTFAFPKVWGPRTHL